MFTQLSINGTTHFVALADTPGIDPASIVRKLASGRVVEISNINHVNGFVNLATVAADLRTLIKQVAAQFVGREELVTAFVTAAVAGESTFVYGPPGTAKTAVASVFTQAVMGKLWRSLFNPDLTRDDIYGAIDPNALKAGQWTRNWSSFATADVAILDEIWKASPQVNNILLDGLEERKVRAGDCEKSIPLVTALAMSNEVPEDSERQAVYDRFLVRLSVTYMRDPGDFETMLTAEAGASALTSNVTTDHLRLMAGVAELLALYPPQDLIATLKELWRELGQNGRSVSDRRWRKTLKLACANALLNGEKPGAHHLECAKWTLWSDLDNEQDIRNLVLSKTDPVAGDVLDCEALLADLNRAASSLTGMDVTGRAGVAGKAKKLINRVSQVQQVNGASKYAGRLEAVKAQAGVIVDQVLEMIQG